VTKKVKIKKAVKVTKEKKIVNDKLIGEKTDRTKYCWNCLYFDKAQYEKPCDTCFGITNIGQYYCYKNWKKGIDDVSQ